MSGIGGGGGGAGGGGGGGGRLADPVLALLNAFHERVPRSWTWFGCKQFKAVLTKAVNALDAALSLSDLAAEDSPLTWLSDGFTRLNGYARDVAIGHNCRFLQCDSTDPSAVRCLRTACEQGSRTRVALWNEGRTPGGFWSLISLHPAVGSDEERLHGVASRVGTGSSAAVTSSSADSVATSVEMSRVSSRRPSHEEGGGGGGGESGGGGGGGGGGGSAGGSFKRRDSTDDPPPSLEMLIGTRARYMMGVQLRLTHDELQLALELCERADAMAPRAVRPSARRGAQPAPAATSARTRARRRGRRARRRMAAHGQARRTSRSPPLATAPPPPPPPARRCVGGLRSTRGRWAGGRRWRRPPPRYARSCTYPE